MEQTQQVLKQVQGCSSVKSDVLRQKKKSNLEALYNDGDFDGFTKELGFFSLYLMRKYGVRASQDEIEDLLKDVQSAVYITLRERPCRQGANFSTYVFTIIRNLISKHFYHEVKRKKMLSIESVPQPAVECDPFPVEGVLSVLLTETFRLDQRDFDAYLLFLKNDGVRPFLSAREEGIYTALSRVAFWRAF